MFGILANIGKCGILLPLEISKFLDVLNFQRFAGVDAFWDSVCRRSPNASLMSVGILSLD